MIAARTTMTTTGTIIMAVAAIDTTKSESEPAVTRGWRPAARHGSTSISAGEDLRRSSSLSAAAFQNCHFRG
jgi:hypothetical protein